MVPLFIPWLLVVLFVSGLWFLIRKKWNVSLGLLIVALLLNWWSECIPLRLWRKTTSSKNEGSLSVLTFNIEGTEDASKVKAKKVLDIINDTNPDIVFFAEFFGRDAFYLDSLLSLVYKSTTYPQFGTPHYFYSKYPLIESKRLNIPNSFAPGIFGCDALIGKDTIHLYGCHLASNNYSASRQ